ncbi:hypothetical protein [Colwellia echini]|uniref:PEP-CTERM protein-sorting domain-containing protein n=1 Tax=Colwellia echini TaxID=1982103 RepID=A0ABY3MWK0_9GAMM|nr:hypothetical protein [Colwellia echini]TYK65554.1 hypothetical protein CWS31_009315 [Colwellia echini]
MTQSIDSLVIGAEYLLEFAYKARTNQLNDNGINVFWYDAATDFNLAMDANFAVDGTHSLISNWTVQSIVLTAQATTMNLSFGAFGKANSLGGLIDNVSLVQVNNLALVDVPEPPVFALSLLGFALLIRRKKNN